MFILLPQGKQSILVSEQHIVAMWEDEAARRTIILTDCGERLWTDYSLREVQEIGGLRCQMAVEEPALRPLTILRRHAGKRTQRQN
jgi:hypothetical protein